jgi:hypothetical protein
MADQNRVQPFREFVQSLSAATFEELAARPEAGVESGDAFEEMRQHLIGLYEGVDARHSFVNAGGQVIDCIPIEQQPAIRKSRQPILEPPATTTPTPAESYRPPLNPAQRASETPPQLHPDYRDRFANRMWCPDGSIPMVRLTLDRLTRSRNLREFFQKTPPIIREDEGLARGKIKPLGDAFQHRHAHASQFVSNVGGSAFVNVWKPVVGPAPGFSLGQHWYVSGSGAARQTVECGWQVSEQIHGTDGPCLFIYWTRDGYETTGCYDLTCSAFVQTNPSIVIGGTLAFSQPGGPQIEYPMGFFLTNGGWWLHFNGQWAGYYPVSLFAGGPHVSGAEIVDFGGETVKGATWPPMGSGAFPDAGFGRAAYMRTIIYYPPAGGALDCNLSPQQSSPGCYRVNVVNASGTDWGTYLYFGGPGGSVC